MWGVTFVTWSNTWSKAATLLLTDYSLGGDILTAGATPCWRSCTAWHFWQSARVRSWVFFILNYFLKVLHFEWSLWALTNLKLPTCCCNSELILWFIISSIGIDSMSMKLLNIWGRHAFDWTFSVQQILISLIIQKVAIIWRQRLWRIYLLLNLPCYLHLLIYY